MFMDYNELKILFQKYKEGGPYDNKGTDGTA